MFESRSKLKEILDETDLDKDLLFQNLKELEFINTYLGGHAVSLKGMHNVCKDKNKLYQILDIGCGGGDSLKALAKWAGASHYDVNLTGLDLKADCINYSKIYLQSFKNISFRCDDFMNSFSTSDHVDIVHASLFCHHFSDQELTDFFRLCNANRAIVVINDLERNPIAYYAIKILTTFFSKSPYVKNDAPVSVLRGFKKREWKNIIEQAGITNYTIQNCWAFRHLVILYPND